MLDPRENRRHPRITLPHTTVVDHARGAPGVLRDISLGGAFIATEAAEAFCTDTGLLLEFALPVGFQVRVAGRVAWIRSRSTAAGPAGYGVEFYALDKATERFLSYYLDLVGAGETTGFNLKVEERYAVVMEARQRLYIKLGAALSADESAQLAVVVRRHLELLSEIRVYFNVALTAAWTKASLEHLRGWLGSVTNRTDLVGVLVGPPSLGMTQIRRLVRETGLADALVSFETTADAKDFWEAIQIKAKPTSRTAST